MKSGAQKSLIYGHCLLLAGVVAAFLSCCTGPAFGVILHPSGEPNLTTWTDRPDSNVVGRWHNNASFVVIAPNWIITTRHQSTFPQTVTIDAVPYICHYKAEWKGGGPSSNADIQLVRLTTANGANPNLAHYAGPYMDTNEEGLEIVIGGYGDGRGGLLKKRRRTYGYKWDNSTNTTLRFGTNKIDGTEDDSAPDSLISDIIFADFDGLGEGDSTIYESIPADHDSGGGWFIKVGDTWKVAGLSRAVTAHYEEGHPDEPDYRLYEAWFRDRANPKNPQPDYLDAVRISSYAAWILDTICVEADLTDDDWVDFADFAVLAGYWFSTDCSAENNWCEGADHEPPYGTVDYDDLAFLLDRWLTGWQY